MAYIPSECSLEEYEKVIYSGDAKNRLYVKHGDTIIGTNGDNNASPFASKMTVKRRILKNGSKTITLNNFISQEIDLVLHDYKIEDLSEEIEIKIGTFIDSVSDYVYVPLGKFLIQDNPTTDKDKTTYKLRDFSVKFDFYYNGKPLIDANGGSATKMQILQDICEQAGVVCKINSFTGYNEKIGIYDNSVTARTYITYLAEQAGKMASINRYGELVFVDITSDDKTVTGEKSIIINDALEKRMNSLVVEGKSEQETRDGYNLFNLYKFKGVGSSTTIKDVVFTVQDDGGIKVQGTASGDADYYITGWWGSTTVGDTYKAGTYSLKPIAENATMKGAFYAISESTVKAGQNFNYKTTVNFSVDTDITAYMLRIFTGQTVDTVVYPMIYAGDDDKPYEMYGKQPSPDYPSEIETVKGIENLFNGANWTAVGVSYDLPTEVANDIEITINENNEVKFNKTGTTAYSGVRSNLVKLKANVTYTISYDISFTSDYTQLYSNLCSYDGSTYTRIYNVGGKATDTTVIYQYTPTQDVDVCIVAYTNYQQTYQDVILSKIKIAIDDIPFVPYGSRYFYNKITGKQLFDYKTKFQSSVSGLTNTINSDGSITISGIPEYNYVGVVTRHDITHKLIDGEEYTISQSVNTNAVTIEVRAVNKISGAITYYQHNKTFTVDLNLYTYNIALLTGTLSSWGTETRTITGFYQLERGSKSTEPEPYKEKIIIYDLKRDNLFDKNTATFLDGYLDNNALAYVEGSARRTLYIPCKPNTSYNVSKIVTQRFTVASSVDVPSPSTPLTKVINRNLAGEIALKTGENDNYLSVWYWQQTDNFTEEEVLNSMKIYESTGNEKYYELSSVPNAKNKSDIITGKFIKKVGKVELDGTTNKFVGKHPTIATDTNGFYQFYLSNKILGKSGDINRAICTHLEYVNISLASNAVHQTCLWWEGSVGSNYASIPFLTLAEANQWLIDEYNKGTPVTIYYELIEPEIIQLQPTEISTFEGVNNITLMDNIDTTISVNYEVQKHIHNISPDIVEKFTVGDTYKVSKVLFEEGVNKFEDGTDDNDTLYLNSDNPYINQQTQINNIYPNVKGFEINSFKTGKILGNPTVDPADLIKIEYNDIIYKTLAQYTLNFSGTMTSTYETTVEHEAKQSNVNNNGTAQLKKFVKAELDNIDAKFSVEVGEVNSSLSDLETNINNTADRVSNTESKLNDTNSSVEELVGRTTKLEQDSKGWEFEFTSIYEDLTALDNKITETDTTTKEIKDYIKFVDGDIILGSSDSENSLVISKTEIAFMTGNNKSAYITNNELYITDNTVLNKQTVGKWETKPDSEGNLNTRWIG